MGTLTLTLKGFTMRIFKSRGFIPLAVLGAIALFNYLNPRPLDQAFESAVKAVKPELVADSGPMSEHYQIVEGSVYDGDTLRVTDGRKELKIRFCGIDGLLRAYVQRSAIRARAKPETT